MPRHDRRSKRDGGRFVALPHTVLDSNAYLSLSSSAKALLVDIARQYGGSNNGKLLICEKALKPRGWASSATVHKAKRELLDAGLLHETRKGHKPNKASWFALTWQTLDWNPEMDIPRSGFERGAYLKINFRPPKTEVESAMTASEIEVETPSTTSETEPVSPVLPPLSTSDSEHYIDIAIYGEKKSPVSNPENNPKKGEKGRGNARGKNESSKIVLADWIGLYVERLKAHGLAEFCPVATFH